MREDHHLSIEDRNFVRDVRNGPCRFHPDADEYEVCPVCKGKGTTTNPAVDSNGISVEDFWADPQFADDYLNGAFDITCRVCGGHRVVAKKQRRY